MGLKALKIVKEEFDKIREDAVAVGHQPDHLDLSRLERAIGERIEAECVEICPACGGDQGDHYECCDEYIEGC